VTTPGGTGTAGNAYQYVTVPPTVTAVNPNTGTNLGGSAVTISGTNFTGATAVTFGGVLATNVTVLTATTITATTPAGTGTVNVAVTTQAGTGTGTNLYTYVTQSPPYPPGKHRLASLIFA
jgi:large repetitive protein